MRVYRFTCFYYFPESERLLTPCLYTHDRWTTKAGWKGVMRVIGRGGVGGDESVSVLIEYKGLDDQGGSSGVR